MVGIRRNKEEFSRSDRSSFTSDRHLHLAFKEESHNIFRMAMVGNQGSRIKDHSSHPIPSQGQGLDPNPFFDLFVFF